MVLVGPWIAIALGYALLSMNKTHAGAEQGGFIAAIAAFMFSYWLLGFKITVTDLFVEYRSGLFRSSRIDLSSIREIKNVWLEFNICGRKIKMPRILIKTQSNNNIIINPKPFSIHDINNLIKIINETKTCQT